MRIRYYRRWRRHPPINPIVILVVLACVAWFIFAALAGIVVFLTDFL